MSQSPATLERPQPAAATPAADAATTAASQSESTVQPGDVTAEELRLDRLPVLSDDTCGELRDRIFALRELWTQRDDELPFYTLGVAGYLDASDGRAEEYRRKAAEIRRKLETEFADLYARVSESLEGLLGHPCIYHPDFSLPGFHIFLHHPEIGSTESGSVHFDLQADNFDWSGHAGVDLERQLSFTLTLSLPAGGSGLLVWDLNEKILRQLPAAERQARMAANRQPRIFPYHRGEMVVHTGQFLHQIARPKESHPGDERITFQGHAVYTDAGWILYW